MLQSLHTNVAICLERAYHAREQALAANDDESRAFWLSMAHKWQDLADGFEFQRRLDRFVNTVPKAGAL